MSRIKCEYCGKNFGNTKKRCPQCNAPVPAKPKYRRWFIVVVMMTVLIACGILLIAHYEKANSLRIVNRPDEPIPTLNELLSMSPEELEQQDIAMVNLVCAKGLYGAEDLNIPSCLAQIDKWADQACNLLEEREFMFHQNPERTDHSLNKWRCAALGQFLSQVIGLSYHSERKDLRAGGVYDTHHFQDARDFMIHGLILEKNRGTCASMPVLYTALARRLGFPVKLVLTRNHLFSRWVDPRNEEVFNIEWTDTYVEFKSNDFYANQFVKSNPVEIERRGYLTPISTERAMSSFMHLRGMCLWFHQDLHGAKDAFLQAYRLNNKRQAYQPYIMAVEKQIQKERNNK